MTEYDYATARQYGFACSDDPSGRVAAGVALYTRQPIGIKWSVELEYDWLSDAIRELPREDREKVCLIFVKRLHLCGDGEMSAAEAARKVDECEQQTFIPLNHQEAFLKELETPVKKLSGLAAMAAKDVI